MSKQIFEIVILRLHKTDKMIIKKVLQLQIYVIKYNRDDDIIEKFSENMSLGNAS